MIRAKKCLHLSVLRAKLLAPKKSNNFHSQMSRSDFLLFSGEHAPVLDTEMRFVFFSHNKVAQTSINRSLLRSRAIVKKDSIRNWQIAMSRYESSWGRRQPFVFTIVRNPYSRTMSAFHYLKKIGKISDGSSFDEFMQSTFLQDGPGFDPHFEPQEKFSTPIYEMGFDRVIKIEELSEQWADIAGMIGAPTHLPKSNQTREEKDALSIELATRRIIEIVYEKDFSGLGYDLVS